MNIVAFVIGFAFFVGGIVLMGYAWDGTTFNWVLFSSGLGAISLGVAVPYHLLKRVDG